jgi:hypothetical protein
MFCHKKERGLASTACSLELKHAPIKSQTLVHHHGYAWQDCWRASPWHGGTQPLVTIAGCNIAIVTKAKAQSKNTGLRKIVHPSLLLPKQGRNQDFISMHPSSHFIPFHPISLPNTPIVFPCIPTIADIHIAISMIYPHWGYSTISWYPH